MAEPQPDIERACEVMHDAYEAAAIGVGWETQERSRKPWADVPEENKATMRAAVSALLDWLESPPADPHECGWMGCGHPRCADLCAGVPLDEWQEWRDDFDYTTADVIPRQPDRHRGWFRRLRDRLSRPGMPSGGKT